MEEFRKIAEFENYSISNLGNVKNNITGRILIPHLNTNGYMALTLVKDRKKYLRYIHRLVAIAFIPNLENKKQVDHINGDKTDNIVENLRWVTVSENCYAYGYEERNLHRQKKIKATHINGETMLFNSRNEVANYFRCSKSQVSYNRVYKKGNKKGWKFELS
jgi:hypothetical protein